MQRTWALVDITILLNKPVRQLPPGCPGFSHLGTVLCKESLLEVFSYWSPSVPMESSSHGKVACTCRSVATNSQILQGPGKEEIEMSEAGQEVSVVWDCVWSSKWPQLQLIFTLQECWDQCAQIVHFSREARILYFCVYSLFLNVSNEF